MADDLDQLMADAASFAETCTEELDPAAGSLSPASSEVVEEALESVERQLAGLEAAFEESESPEAQIEQVASDSDDPSGEAELEAVAVEPVMALDETEAAMEDLAAAVEARDSLPRAAPREWLTEAGVQDQAVPDTSVSLDEGLPDISEVAVKPTGAPSSTAKVAVGRTLARITGLRRLASAIMGLPLLGLRVLDFPFSGLSLRTKSAIGYLAIGTLVMAIATWIAGSYNIGRS